MATTSLGRLTLDLVAQVGQFTEPLDKAERKARDSAKSISKEFDIATTAVKALGVAVAGISITGITNFANQTIQAGSNIKRFAELSNASLQQFQFYAKGAETAGISMESFADKMKDMQDRIGDFDQTKGGPLADFFTNIAPKVGVTIQQFQKLSGPEALQLFYSSLEKTNASQNDMKFYMEAIISDSSLLIPLLKNGGEGFKKWGNAAKEAGAIMSDDFVESAVLAKEQLNLLNLKWEGFKNNAINDFAVPAITGLSNNLEAVTNTLMIGTAYMAGSYIPTMILGTKTLITDTFAKVANTVAARKKVMADYEVAKSNLAATAAMVRAMGTTNAQTAAMMTNARAAYQQAASAKSAALANATLGGVLGGPIGLGVMAASAAAGFLLMKDSSKDTQSALDDQALSVEELKVKYSQLNAEQLKLKALDAGDAIEEQNEKIASSLTALQQYISDLNAQGKSGEAKTLQQYLDDLKTGGERAATAFSRLEKQSIVSPHSIKMAAEVGSTVKTSNREIDKQNQILSIASNKHIDHAKAAKTGAEGVALVGKEAISAAAKVKNLGEEVQKFINDALNSTTDNLRKYQLISQGYSAATADMILAAEKVEGIGTDSPFGKNAALSVFSTSALATQVLSQKRLSDLTEDQNKSLERQQKIREKNAALLASSNEQTRNMLKTYQAFLNAGVDDVKARVLTAQVGREGDFLSKNLYGNHSDAANGKTNTGIFSWQGDRSKSLINYLRSQGVLDDKGNIQQTQEALDAQAKYFIQEVMNLKRFSPSKNALVGNSTDYRELEKVFGKNAIAWDYAGNSIGKDKASKNLARQDAYYAKLNKILGNNPDSFLGSFKDLSKQDDDVYKLKARIEEEKKSLIEYYDDWQKLENNNSEQVKKIREAFAKDPKAMEYYLSLQAQAYQKDVENYIRAGDDRVKAEYQATQEIIAARQAAYNSINDPINSMRDKGVEARAQASMTPMQYQSWQLNSEQQDGYSQLGNDLMDAVNAINESQILSEQEKYDQLEKAHKDYVNNKSALDVLYDKQTKDLARSQQIEQVNMWGGILSTGQNTFSQLAQSAKDGLGEQSSTYRTMFAMQQAFSVASSMVAAWTAYTTAFADPSAMTLTQKFAGGAAVMAALMPALTTIGSISIQGMAHNGIDNIPSEGTWLLDGGERVLNPQQNKDLTRYLSESRSNQNTQSAQFTVNPQIVILDERKAMGDYLQSREGEQIILKTLKRNGYAR